MVIAEREIGSFLGKVRGATGKKHREDGNAEKQAPVRFVFMGVQFVVSRVIPANSFSRKNQVYRPRLNPVMPASLLAKRFLLLPNRLYTLRSVLWYGPADPGKNLNEPRLASVLRVSNDHVRLGKD